MTREEMVRVLAERTGQTVHDVRVVVTEFLEQISASLMADGTVNLKDFGTFLLRRRGPRKWHNVHKHGEYVDIPARNIVMFRPAPCLRERAKETPLESGRMPTHDRRRDGNPADLV